MKTHTLFLNIVKKNQILRQIQLFFFILDDKMSLYFHTFTAGTRDHFFKSK